MRFGSVRYKFASYPCEALLTDSRSILPLTTLGSSLLAQVSRYDALAGDLAWELLDTLTRAPLTLRGLDTGSTVIYIIARELAYANCTFQHSWLGMDLLGIVETTLRTRALTDEELNAIHDMASRRQEQ
jgi:hypothetical protein